MLTMKHVCYDGGVKTEFCRPIGCFSTRQDNNELFTFLAYDKRDTDTPDIWGGKPLIEGIETSMYARCSIYVMNEHGATVAQYQYWWERQPKGADAPLPVG